MNPSDPLPWLTVMRARSRDPLQEFSLVLTATGIDHRIEFDGHDWCLEVDPVQHSAALRELARYRHENRPVAAPVTRVPVIDSGVLGVLGYLLVIWALPWLEATLVFDWSWRDAGVLAAQAVREGEWWRTITALTLHADIAHLIANSLFGALFGLFAGRYLGSGLAWLLILLGGALGNGLNAWLQPDMFRSIGASTATFAALALVGAYVWRRGYMRGMGWRRRFAPVFGGIAMLAYTGFGGENTDVMAHITGFLAGLVLGLLAPWIPVRRLGRSGQVIAGAGALGLVLMAWRLAGAAV